MLLVGATARNTGKTTFCTGFIRKWTAHFDIIGVKVTTVHDEKAHCHHGNVGCGVCTNFKGEFDITEESVMIDGKDTCELLKAGAAKVYWIKANKNSLADAFSNLISKIPKSALIVCESNSLSSVVTPAVIVVSSRTDVSDMKPSAGPMLEKADFIVDVSDQGNLLAVLDSILVESTGLECRLRTLSGGDTSG